MSPDPNDTHFRVDVKPCRRLAQCPVRLGIEPLKRIDQLHEWLATNIGRDNYGTNADSIPGVADALSIYLRTRDDAERLFAALDELGLQVVDPRDWGYQRPS